MNMRDFILLALVLILCAGCSVPQPVLKRTVAFASIEDFKRGPEGGVDLVWSTARIRDGASLKTTLQKYDSLILGQTWLLVDRETSGQLTDKQILWLSRHMIRVIKDKLGHGFKLVETPTDTTLCLSIALTNIETLNPVLAMTGALLPVNHRIPMLSRIVAGEHPNVAGSRVELLVSDALSNEPLIAAIDKGSGNKDLGTMIASQADAQEAISWWVERFLRTLGYWNWIKKRTPSS